MTGQDAFFESALGGDQKVPPPMPSSGSGQDDFFSERLRKANDPALRPTNPEFTEAGQRTDMKKDARYDPRVKPEQYVWNEIKKVPGGLLGLAPDALDWLMKKIAHDPAERAKADFGHITKSFQEFTGADVNMKPTSRGAERAGIIASNVAGSLPFAAVAAPVRGVAGFATEMLSGLGGGAGQVMGREMGAGPLGEIAGNMLGSMAGYRTGNIIEKAVPVVKSVTGTVRAGRTKEALAAARTRAVGLIEGSPEYQAAMVKEMEVAKREVLTDIVRSYAQEDMGKVNRLISEYDDIKKTFPGFKASIGEITGNEPALALQANIESRNIPALEERGARIRANQAAVDTARGNLAPGSARSERAAFRGVKQSIDDELRALGQTSDTLAGDLAATSGRIADSAVPLPRAGEQIKAASTEGYVSSKGVADQKYGAFRAAVPEGSVADAGDVVSKVDELRSKFVFDKEPEVIGRLKGRLAAEVTEEQASQQFGGILSDIRKLGGISSKEMRDLSGEIRVGNGVKIAPGTFTKNGRGLDDLVTVLRERGYPIPEDAVDGGVAKLRTMIRDELNGTGKTLTWDQMDAKQAQDFARFKQSRGQGEAPKQLTILELDDLSAAANRDIQRERSRSNPDRKVIAQLSAIREEAQSTITKALQAEGNEAAIDAYAEARRYFGQEHAPKYLTGVNLKLRLQDSLNEQRIKPEDVVSAYFKPGGITEARRFNTQFANNGAAKEVLARGVFDQYKREVIDKFGGVIKPQAHDLFMRKYADTLKEYPWIAKRLEKNNVAGEIASRMDDVRSNMAKVAESELAKIIGKGDVDAFINGAISDKRTMFNEMARLSKDGRKNMGIAILNKAWDEAGSGSAAVNKFLESEDNFKMAMRLAFGKDVGERHVKNLRLLARALEINEAAPKISPAKALTEDTMKAQTGTSWTQLFAAARAVIRRPGSEGWFAGVFGGQLIRSRFEARKVEALKQQLFDPDLLDAAMMEYKAKSAGAKIDATGMATTRGKEVLKKMGDLTLAFFGKDAPTAAAKRLPVAIVTAEDQQ